jgi:hypothetical protein
MRDASGRVTSGLLAAALAIASGCGSAASLGGDGGPGGGVTISSQPLAGKIGGQPWTFVAGETDAFLSDATSFFTTLYSSSFTACSFGRPTGENEVLLQLPTTAGSYNLSLGMNATLYDAASQTNWVATRGRVEVTAITATTITGGMNITYNADNTVDGQFSVTICPD